MVRGDSIRTARRKRLAALVAIASLTGACSSAWDLDDGVASRTVWAKARGIDGFDLQLFAPADGQGAARGPRPGIVFAPGGFVDPQRYAWFGRAMAKRGYVVAVPEFALGLGFFTADNLDATRRVLVQGDSSANLAPLASSDRLAVAGHSLGGVVAAGAAIDGGFGALVLMASYAAGGENAEGLKIPVLSIAGENDCDALLADVKTGARRFPSLLFAEVGGLTHYGFTDALTEDDAKGCKSGVSIEDGHARLAALVDTWLAQTFDHDAEAAAKLAAGLPGITLSEKP